MGADTFALTHEFLAHLDPRTGKWIRACYRAELQEIAARYAEFEITGPPETREISSQTHYFTPHQHETPLRNLGLVIAVSSLSRRVQVVGVAS